MNFRRSFLSFCRLSLLAATLVLPQGFFLNSQILPDAPVEGIRLTMFSDEGFKVWFLQGDSASYLEDGSIKMSKLDLEVFKDSEQPEKDMHILGNEAIYQVDERSVSGDGGVFVDGEFYEIEGDSWHYSEVEKIVRVKSNVKVVIDYQMQPFLK